MSEVCENCAGQRHTDSGTTPCPDCAGTGLSADVAQMRQDAETYALNGRRLLARVRELEAEIARLRPAAEMAMRFAAADKARCDAIHAYNAELKRQRERGIFPVRVDPEYAAMEAAKVYYWAACKKLIEVCGVGSTVSSAPADPG